jgi:hypothetical protein
MTTITRLRDQGRLLLNGTPVVLRGGTYDLFSNPGQSTKAIMRLASGGQRVPLITTYETGKKPCQTSDNKSIAAALASWAEPSGSFDDLFNTMRADHCNFVRVFLYDKLLFRPDHTPVSVLPFNGQVVGQKYMYDIRGAALNGRWNNAYFDRLRAFVAAADAAGVVVQLSLFNYDDLVADTWGQSFWNAGNSLDPAWGATHLIPNDRDVDARQEMFVTSVDPVTMKPVEIRAVQQEFIGRVMQAVSGHQNVVLELMNEPHMVFEPSDLSLVAEFDSYMTKLIVLYRSHLNVPVLISVNAVFAPPAQADGLPDSTSDLVTWKNERRPYFSEVDIVSYHALTALGYDMSHDGCKDDQGIIHKVLHAARVDSKSIDDRANIHAASHPDKALLYSTDAVFVKQFHHEYANTPGMEVRDGQIIVCPKDESLDQQLLCTHVYHWATKCLYGNAESASARGRYHFHDHSSFEQGLYHAGRAATALGL